MTEKFVRKEKQVDNELLNRLLKWEIFPRNNGSEVQISTIDELLIATEREDAEKRMAEILSNLNVNAKNILNRVAPRVESWQATRLLDHIRLWLKAPRKKFWLPQSRALKHHLQI